MTSCPDGIGLERLSDYGLGELPEAEAEAIERHLFACDACTSQLAWLSRLGPALRDLLKAGELRVAVSPAFLERAARDGLRVREYRVPAGVTVPCTITPDDDLLVSRLQAELSGVERVDVLWRQGDAPEVRIPDVPVSGGREVITVQHAAVVRQFGDVLTRVRLLDVSGGRERLLGEYGFDHHPTR